MDANLASVHAHGIAGLAAIIAGANTRFRAAYGAAGLALIILAIEAIGGFVPILNLAVIEAWASIAGTALGAALAGLMGYSLKRLVQWVYRKVTEKDRRYVNPSA